MFMTQDVILNISVALSSVIINSITFKFWKELKTHASVQESVERGDGF